MSERAPRISPPAVEARLTHLEGQMTGLDERVGGIERQIIRLEERMEAGFEAVNIRIDRLDGRMGKMEQSLAHLGGQMQMVGQFVIALIATNMTALFGLAIYAIFN